MTTTDETETAPRASLVTRAGTALGASAVAALACGLFVAIRGGGAFGSRWLVAAAMTAPAATLLVVLFSRARAGLRLVASDGGSSVLAACIGSLALAGPVLAALGYVLAAKTHHHGLAGATYALAAAVVVLGSLLVSQRVVVAVAGDESASEQRSRRAFTLACVAALFGVVVPLAAAMLRLPNASRSEVAMTAFDCALLFVSTWLASSVEPLGRRTFARVGVPLWILVALLGSRVSGSIVHERVPTTLSAIAPWIR